MRPHPWRHKPKRSAPSAWHRAAASKQKQAARVVSGAAPEASAAREVRWAAVGLVAAEGLAAEATQETGWAAAAERVGWAAVAAGLAAAGWAAQRTAQRQRTG